MISEIVIICWRFYFKVINLILYIFWSIKTILIFIWVFNFVKFFSSTTECDCTFENVSTLYTHAAGKHYYAQLHELFKTNFMRENGMCTGCPNRPINDVQVRNKHLILKIREQAESKLFVVVPICSWRSVCKSDFLQGLTWIQFQKNSGRSANGRGLGKTLFQKYLLLCFKGFKFSKIICYNSFCFQSYVLHIGAKHKMIHRFISPEMLREYDKLPAKRINSSKINLHITYYYIPMRKGA